MAQSRFELIFTDGTGIHVVNAPSEYYPLNVLTTIALALEFTGAATSTKIREIAPASTGVILRQHMVWYKDN